MIRCLGGWCESRDRCAHYWQACNDPERWADRLCERGKEVPVPIVKSVRFRNKQEARAC